MMKNQDLPPFPPISHLMEELPEKTKPVVVSTSDQRLKLWANSDNSSKNAWVPDIVGQPGSPPFVPILMNYWDGKPPIDYTLTMRHFWRMVPNTFTHIQPGGGFDKLYTVSHGISTTDAHSISAELGVSVEGLSAKISATFSHSVTVSKESVEQTHFSVGSPEVGYERVWVLWQLVREIVALDPAGKVIPRTEAGLNREGDVKWCSAVPIFSYTSGAFLSYPNPQQEFPSTIYIPQQADFPKK